MKSPKVGKPFVWSLPMELTLLVLGELDKPTLALCALVCRTWLDLAWAILFKSIAYRPCYPRFPLQRSDVPAPLQDLVNFVTSPSLPNLGRHIRHLSLSLPRAKWTVLTAEDKAGVVTLVPCRWQTFIALLHALPRLRTLELENFVLESPGPPHDVRPLTATPCAKRLETLTFSRQCRARDIDGCLGDLLHLLSLFARIDRLVLGAFFSPPGPHTHAALAAHVHTEVHELAVHASSLLTNLPPLPGWAHIKCLALPLLLPADVPATLHLVDNTRERLRSVSLCVPHLEDRDTTVACLRALTLEHCPHLNTLVIVLPLYGVESLIEGGSLVDAPPYFTSSAYEYITHLLEYSSHTLRRVVIELKPSERWQHLPADESQQVNWSTLDDVLTRRAQDGLKVVEFQHNSSRESLGLSGQIQAYFARMMPLLWKTGKVRVI